MNRIEDALRDAFDADLRAPAAIDVDDVRRGVRRRRQRRAVATVAAVTVVVAGLGVGGALLTEDSEDDLEPAPGPTVTEPADPAPSTPGGTPTDPEPVTGESPERVTAMGDGGGQVFALAHPTAGELTVLWHLRDGEWVRLHDFPIGALERLAVAPDGQNLWVSGPGTRVWASHDGGESWTATGLAGGDETGMSFQPAATSSSVWVLDLTGNRLWRAPVGSDDFTEEVVGGSAGALGLAAVEDAVLVTPWPDGEGSVESAPLVSRDDGATWSALPFPCGGENSLLTAATAAFVVCHDIDADTVFRSGDLTSWEELATVPGRSVQETPLSADGILLRGDAETLVTGSGATTVETGLSRGQAVWGAAAVDEFLYLGTDAGVLVSADGGLTWQPVG